MYYQFDRPPVGFRLDELPWAGGHRGAPTGKVRIKGSGSTTISYKGKQHVISEGLSDPDDEVHSSAGRFMDVQNYKFDEPLAVVAGDITWIRYIHER